MTMMEDKAQHRAQLSKSIGQKVDLTAQLREQLNVLKKTTGNSVDDQIVLAELEYRLVKEEMALLTLQEQHWQSAALCHAPEQLDPSDILHSYIVSVRKSGSVPALHATDSLHPDHSVLVSSRGDLPTVTGSEWSPSNRQRLERSDSPPQPAPPLMSHRFPSPFAASPMVERRRGLPGDSPAQARAHRRGGTVKQTDGRECQYDTAERETEKGPGGVEVSKPAAEAPGTVPTELTPLPPQVLGEERADRFHRVRPPRHPIHPVEEA
ncbi:UNVERIFIED_CONTAM: hypothetical protein NCL1_12926 [Trichonephila clavipes]